MAFSVIILLFIVCYLFSDLIKSYTNWSKLEDYILKQLSDCCYLDEDIYLDILNKIKELEKGESNDL